jgi:hypothetical protein
MNAMFSTNPWPIFIVAVAGTLIGVTALLAGPLRSQRWASQVPALMAMSLGLSILAWQAYEIDREEARELDAAEARLAPIPRPPEFDSVDHWLALTDAGRRVSLFQIRPCGTKEVSSTAAANRISMLHLNKKLIQTGPVSDECNCHGWIFTGGCCWIKGNSVEQILKDNCYRTVSSPAVSDLVVFRDDKGVITHTGVIHGFAGDGTPLLESKWGRLGRFVHTSAQHIYGDNTCTYYRSSRVGHLLRGIESDPKTNRVPRHSQWRAEEYPVLGIARDYWRSSLDE